MCFLGGVGAWEWAKMVGKMYKGPDMRYLSLASAVALMLAWVFSKGGFFGSAAVPAIMGPTVVIILGIYIAIGFAKVDIASLFPWLMLHLGAPLYLGLWGGVSVRYDAITSVMAVHVDLRFRGVLLREVCCGQGPVRQACVRSFD